MVLDVTYTYDDYAEANTAHMASGVSRGRARVGLLGWVVFIALAVVLFVLLRGTATPGPAAGTGALPPAPPATRGLINILLPLLPWLLVFLAIWFFVFRLLRAVNKTRTSSLLPPGSGRPDPALGPPTGAAGRSALSWVIIITCVVGWLVVTVINAFSSNGDSAGAPPRSPLVGAAMTALPWFFIFFGFMTFVRRAGVGVKRMWDGQPQLQRPKRIEIAEPGVVVIDGVSRSEQLWEAFTHARETPNLFLLYFSEYSFQMIPKRCFATTADADAFRELVRRTVVERPPPAFPVMPAGSIPQRAAPPTGYPPSPTQPTPIQSSPAQSVPPQSPPPL